MPRKKYNIDPERLKKICRENPNPSIHKKIAEYIEELYPEQPKMTKAQKERRAQIKRQASRSAWNIANNRGWIQQHHNAVVTSSAWPTTKRKKFKKYVAHGTPIEKIANDPLFRTDFPHGKNHQIVFHNYIQRICPELRAARIRAIQQQRERERMRNQRHQKKEKNFITQLIATHKFLTLSILTQALGEKKKAARLLQKLCAEGKLIAIFPQKSKDTKYLSTEYQYQPEEVAKILPSELREYIDRRLIKILKSKSAQDRKIRAIEKKFERGKRINLRILRYYIQSLVNREIIIEGKEYSLSPFVEKLGIQFFGEEVLRHISRLAQERRERNEEIVRDMAEEQANFSGIPLDRLAKLPGSDQRKKIDPEITYTTPQRILFLNLLRAGHHATDKQFIIDTVRLIAQRPPDQKPTLLILHGGFSGSFRHQQIARKRTLERPLTQISGQLEWVRRIIEEIGLPFIYVLGSNEDQLIVSHYTIKAVIEEEGMKGLGFSPEALVNVAYQKMITRAESFPYWERLQEHIIFPYIVRNLRHLRNAKEMQNEFGILSPERDLIIRATKAIRRGEEPDDDCKRVLNIPCLKNTPERSVVEHLRLKYPSLFLQMISYITYSPSSPHKEPLKSMREYLQKIHKNYPVDDIPDVMVTGNEGEFGWCYVPPGLFGDTKQTGTLGINLPACQNEKLVAHMGVYHGRVMQDPIAKRLAKQKSIRPMVVEQWGTRDHIFLAIDNHTFRNVRKATGDHNVQRSTIALWHDVQIGLDQARCDLAIKYLDYTLYTLQADVLLMLGDLGNFINYLAALSHNTQTNLPGVDLQLEALKYILKHIFPREFARGLKKVRIASGNHEWNTPPRSHHLDLQHLRGIQWLGEGIRPDVDFRFCKRITLKNRNVTISLSQPFGTDILCGLRVAYAHLWSGKFRQGAIPTQEQVEWALAHGARDVDIMLAGHQASSYGKQDGDSLYCVFPGFEEPTDWTLAMHQAQNVLAGIVHLSTAPSEPPTIEFLTRQWLEEYQCQSPLLTGKNIDHFVKEACEFAKRIDGIE